MPKIKLHKLVAFAVLIITAVWVATGEFTSVGSAAGEAEERRNETTETPETPLRVVAVIDAPRIEHARAIHISGYTDADKRAVLATRGAGVIEELPIKLGSHVNRGDLIVSLEEEGQVAAVETAKQVLAQREAEAQAARQLAERGNLPKLQLDNVLSALSSARSQLEAAQASLARNEVRAPFDGIIDKVDVELGSAVQPGTTVATILNLNPILARGEISERDLVHIKTGNKADVRLVNGQKVEGEVRHLSRDATKATRTFRVEVAIPNDDGAVPAGMTAEITLRADPVSAVVLPRSVVTLSDDGDLGVRTVNSDDIVVFYPIDLVDDMQNGLVLGGIPDDVRIIVAGQELISEGDKVNPVEADAELIRKLVGDLADTSR